jgi:probable HAF family extracellular repeat protein
VKLSRLATMVIAAVAAVPLAVSVNAPAGATRPTITSYEFVDLGTLGGQSSYATAMNNRGEVVGSSQVADGTFHGFHWRRGVMTDLGDLRPYDINDRGQIVGTVDVAGGWRAVRWSRGRSIDLGTLGGAWATPTAVNDRGQVVGCSAVPNGPARPFLWTNGRMRELPLDSVAGINRRGQVAGGLLVGAGFHAAVWHRGTVVDLGALAFDRSNAYGINDRGWVIGWAYSPQQNERGILRRNRTMTDVGTLGGTFTHLVAVNGRGQILGISADPAGFERPVLWQRGVLTDLTTRGIDFDGNVVDLNDRGDIAASFRPVFGTSHAAVFRRSR